MIVLCFQFNATTEIIRPIYDQNTFTHKQVSWDTFGTMPVHAYSNFWKDVV